MIINHTYRFIFLKTRKTAGTSIEIALSQFCGSQDVITPIRWQDERIRRQLGYPEPRNFRAPLVDYRLSDWLALFYQGSKRKCNNHFTAAEVNNAINPDIWHNYFKFCFERNPFDKAISRYY
ncbi:MULTISPECIES: sulfotransferase family 2 domain-containing protein [unclassified Thermosynechococcus]|uniref:sulfotransferase family 2 domain-containing protein n=1 Tax=unclassified Thermosynechococcus TaxID=2622553 RepID=UPI00197ED8AF|nr:MULTISPECIES: sulfotransferase family 2 domain-containing protein [unclassified Thermosynechococcus]MDR5638173.1 sulfotransferase family 2 domain-containing protein [Thermosynechococcus sp. PP42]MDR7920862.1 sulfotransferase family 2 domain-containing protein [Thermosynechococcus sp. HY213]QSF49481.1 sulfotransferase family 2 domain-containing protein [Thermosynechococcus sp. TA-1]WKT81501.1 sulfotransferase family 2 domain-containing protein [Thermosynechococcus sp. PP45]WNC25113.1 sulfotr